MSLSRSSHRSRSRSGSQPMLAALSAGIVLAACGPFSDFPFHNRWLGAWLGLDPGRLDTCQDTVYPEHHW